MTSILAPKKRRGDALGGVVAFATALWLLTACLGSAAADQITLRVTVPAETPSAAVVYIAGDFQGWNPGDPVYSLTKIGAQLHEITLTLAFGTPIEFKFTRGDWGSVEKGPNGEEIPNRTLTVNGDQTVTLTVQSWADISPGSTIVGDVTQITVPGFLSGRRVWVYLPPTYHDEPNRRFPVLYMLDGQNVFNDATSFSGEWEVDETCEQLIPAGEIDPIIVVAVANGEGNRITEYTPWPDPSFGGGGGDVHLQAFIDVLMPHVDGTYRTLATADNTALAGSSLGGLITMYAAYEYPDVFGRTGALSASFWWDSDHLVAWAATKPKPETHAYMDMGTAEGADAVDRLRAMRDLMLSQGFVLDDDLKVVEDEGAQHNEFFWAARFPEALRFLFAPRPVSAPEPWTPAFDLAIAPNPFAERTSFRFETRVASTVELVIFDVAGRRVRGLSNEARAPGRQEVRWDGRDDRGTAVPAGVYFVRLEAGQRETTRKLVLSPSSK